MLLNAKRRDWPLPGYRRPGHPLQEEAAAIVSAAAGVPTDGIPTAVDGCGVVTFALSLEAMASAFARLVRSELPGSDRVVAAMRSHPDLVGGPTAADTAFMRALPNAVVKRGAEGLLCGALADGTGIAVKVEDGADRAAGPALARFLGVPGLDEAPVFNSCREEVGRVSAES